MGAEGKEREALEGLVELAPEETVLRALAQSAHPVEFLESSGPAQALSAPAEPPAPAEPR